MEEKIIVPDLIEPIVGWRFWRIRESASNLTRGNSEQRFELHSVVMGNRWPKKEKLRYQCCCKPADKLEVLKGRFSSSGFHLLNPTNYSLCGIYAYKTSQGAAADMYGRLDAKAGSMIRYYSGNLLGKVNLWGVVQEHEFGYRAEYAYPLSFVLGVCGDCCNTFFLSDSDNEMFFFVTQQIQVRVPVSKNNLQMTNRKIQKLICFNCVSKLEGNKNTEIFPGSLVIRSLEMDYGIV